MRDLTQYRATEWLSGRPAVAWFKEWRDAGIRDLYCRQPSPELPAFLDRHRGLRDRQIAVIIAYEYPWLIDRMIRRLARYIPAVTPVICDNSRTPERRDEIGAICSAAKVPYLSLPPSPVRNINRSHGNAVNWTYRNVVMAIEPEIMILLDHDIFPTGPYDFAERLGDQPFYGMKLDKGFGWALWAGLSAFRWKQIRDVPVDFNPDMDRGLLTGGRNYRHLYRHHDPAGLRFATHEFRWEREEGFTDPIKIEVVDEWVHIAGSSHDPLKINARAHYEAILARSW